MINFVIDISRLSPFIAAAVNIILGSIIYLKDRKNDQNRTFFLFSIILAAWAFCCFIQSITIDEQVGLLWDKILYSFAAFAPMLLLGVVNSFIKVNLRKLFIFSYLAGVLIIISNWFGYFREGVSFNFGARFVTEAAYGWYIYVALYGLLIGVAFYELFIKIKNSNGKERYQYKVLFASLIILIMGGNCYFILILKKFNPLIDSVLNLNSSLYLCIYSLLMSYLIVKYDFMDIKARITRGVAYVTTGILLVISFTIIYLYAPFRGVLLTAVGLIWMLYGDKLRQRLQTAAEVKWLSDYYNPSEVINALSNELSPLFERTTIINTAVKDIHQVLKLRTWQTFIAQTDKDDNITHYERQFKDELKTETVDKDEPIIAFFQHNQQVLHSQDIPELKEEATKYGISKKSVFMPVFSPSGLEGLIIIGERLSETIYTKKDMDFFYTVATTIGVFLDRMRPYEKIQKEFEKNKQKMYELELNSARTTELKKITTTIQEYNHELRHPLSKIKLTIEDFPDSDKKTFLTEEVTKALDIVNTTLRLSTDKPKVRKTEDLHLNEVIEKAVKSSQMTNIQYIKELSATQIINGNDREIEMIFTNMFSNAIEAMPDGGAIKISTKDMDDGVEVRIRDTGCGIPADSISTIWQPFISSHVTKGRGLGLSIVQKIINEHNATIRVESKVGEGTAFIIRFPV